MGVLLMVCLAALVHGARNPFAPRVASSRSHHHHHHHHRQHHRQQLADVPGVVFPPVDSSGLLNLAFSFRPPPDLSSLSLS